jgi:hypothetical protein
MVSLIKDQKGSATVELAVFVMLLVMIIFGFVTITKIIKDNLGMHIAAREAARHLSIWYDYDEAEEVAIHELAAAGVKSYGEIEVEMSGNDAIVCISAPRKIPFIPGKTFATKAEYKFHIEVHPDIYYWWGYYE